MENENNSNNSENNEFEEQDLDSGGTVQPPIDDNFHEGKRERRNSKRFDEKLAARLGEEQCVVLNVSEKGVLLQTHMPVYFFALDKIIDFELRLKDQWVVIRGKVMWTQSDALHSKIGLFIQHAPEPYFNFLKELYEG